MKFAKLWPWRDRTLAEELNLATPVDAGLVTNTMLLEFLRERRSERRWGQMKKFLFILVILGGFALSIVTALQMMNAIPPLQSNEYKVGTVTIKGIIGDGQGSAESVLPAIKKAFEDKRTEVIVLRIDSPGGSPSEAERIYTEVERLKAKHNKPVEAVIDNLGASAAYLIAIHTDRITAGHYSLVGSVGAIMHSWNAAELAHKLGVQQLEYASGALKGMGNPTRMPSDLEAAKGKALVSGIADLFAADVVAQRGPRLKMDVPTLTTGEAWSGADAMSFGLVDDIGTLESVLVRLEGKGRNFGPFPHSMFSDAGSDTAKTIGGAFMDGMLSSLKASMQTKGGEWRAQ